MKRQDPLLAKDGFEEIATLIETLHATERRLELLTRGEVDTVADREGRTFLLRQAQEHLRRSDAAKQLAILNALPAHIVLLNPLGLIVSLNDGWRRFANANALQTAGYGLGINYLEVCDHVLGAGGSADASEARQAAAGIRSVLNGESAQYSLEYPCHSPEEQRWFLMTVTPITDSHINGAVVMHLDITAKRKSDEAWRASELQFRQMAENITDVFFLRDADSKRILYVSPAYEEIWGRSCASLYARPESWSEAMHVDDLAANTKLGGTQIEHGELNLEYRITRPDGSIRWIETRTFPVHDAAGLVVRIAGIAKDVTERKEAQSRISYLNRMYATLSGINSLIVRARNHEELFREACRIAVEQGGFRMALIAMVKDIGIQLVASNGVGAALLESIEIRLASDKDAAITMTAQAILEKTAIVANDSQNDPRVLFAAAYEKCGVRSMAIFPLLVADKAVGVLALYASEIEFFQQEELKLLSELTGDIAFAVDHLDKQERIDYLAYYDVLTGLANRTLFLERLAQHMRSAAADGQQLALFLFDLDRFKNINDSLGRPAGDALLRQVAEWLTARTGDSTLLSRVGEDHFAVVLPKVSQTGNVERLIEKAMDTFLKHPFRLDEAVLRISAKVGIALFPRDASDADLLYRNAEAALKKAKSSGDPYLFYAQKMTARAADVLKMETQLRQALEHEEFVLHYQPKINLSSGKMTSAEALIRWNDPRSGLVPPGLFIPILEETGLIYAVGRWALRKAIADYLRWLAMGLPVVRIAVNVSPLQLRSRGFIAEVTQAINVDPRAAAGIELEITESLIMENIKHSISSLEAIRAMGLTIAIDDFGTGFSSLSYLAKLPVDTLKIDRSFIIDMTASTEGLSLVSTIIGLAHSLKLKVVAEGVETEEQERLLRLLNCDETQGYLFSRPVPAEIFETKFLVA